MKKLFFAFAMVLAGLALSACDTNSPSVTAEKVLKTIQQGNYDQFVELIYTDDDNPEEVAQLRSLIKEKAANENKNEIESYEILNETIDEDGQTATVTYKVKYKDEKEPSQESMKLRKNKKGEWKMDLAK